jgi:hypothetical protein
VTGRVGLPVGLRPEGASDCIGLLSDCRFELDRTASDCVGLRTGPDIGLLHRTPKGASSPTSCHEQTPTQEPTQTEGDHVHSPTNEVEGAETAESRARESDHASGRDGEEPRIPAGVVSPAPDWYRPHRPPFATGHELATRHGAWSPRRVDPLAEGLVAVAVQTAGWLAEPTFGPAVWAWARAEARCQLLAEWLDEHGLLTEGGDPVPALDAATRLEKLALTHRQRLGLDPAARAGLEATLTSAAAGQYALEDAIIRGREALSARRPTDAPTASVGEAEATAEPDQPPMARP